MTKQEKLDKIYEVIARKDLSFGCIYKEVDGNYIAEGQYATFREKRIVTDVVNIEGCEGIERRALEQNDEFTKEEEGTRKIIGHPVMIGDLLDWVEKKQKYTYNNEEIANSVRNNGDDYDRYNIIRDNKELELLDSWEYKSKPIENQSDECIDYIYSLVN